MKIAQNPNLMRCFMDPRFSTVIQELQTNPQECLKKYGNNPEFSTFIKEFSALMGDHFNNLAKNPLQGNPNYNNPEVQEIINDPKIKPILERLQKEGKKEEKKIVLKDKSLNKIPDDLKNNNTLFSIYLVIKSNYLGNKEKYK